jgi:hypothetical protein
VVVPGLSLTSDTMIPVMEIAAEKVVALADRARNEQRDQISSPTGV